MRKRQKDMCPFNYWRAREGNSECTGVWAKAKGTFVLLAIGVLSMTYVGEKAI